MKKLKVIPQLAIDWEEMAVLRGLEIDRLEEQIQNYNKARNKIIKTISSTYNYETELELSTALIKIADIIKELDDKLKELK